MWKRNKKNTKSQNTLGWNEPKQVTQPSWGRSAAGCEAGQQPLSDPAANGTKANGREAAWHGTARMPATDSSQLHKSCGGAVAGREVQGCDALLTHTHTNRKSEDWLVNKKPQRKKLIMPRGDGICCFLPCFQDANYAMRAGKNWLGAKLSTALFRVVVWAVIHFVHLNYFEIHLRWD